MEEFAQPVSNEKLPSKFDWDAATAVAPNTNAAGWFQHLVDSNPALGPRAFRFRASQTREHSVALPGTNDVIRRFDRDTAWLATVVVGAVVSAALLLAVLVQDRHPRALDLTVEAMQAGGDLLLNANASTHFNVMGLNGKSSTGKTTSGEASSVDHAFTEISPNENPSSQIEAAASTVLRAFTPQINRHDVAANAGSWTLAHRQDSGRATGLKFPRARTWSSARPKFVDLKMRLIALWHQILPRSERPRSWTLFSNSKKGDRKKVSYTAETYHRGTIHP